MAIENLQKSEGITSHKSGLLNSHVSVCRPGGLPCCARTFTGISDTSEGDGGTPLKCRNGGEAPREGYVLKNIPPQCGGDRAGAPSYR